MATIYYVDSENVADSWIDLLSDADSRFLVFYTNHSPNISYKQMIQLLNAPNKPEFIKCYEGNNGLDFQLVSYLGYELHCENSNEMIIVSNDTGFDTVVSFWAERGMNVKRVSRLQIHNMLALPSFDEPVAEEELPQNPSAETVSDTICGVKINELYTLVNCIGTEDLVYLHGALVSLYGSESGRSIYMVLKGEDFVAPEVKWKKKTKLKKYIDIILKYTCPANLTIPDNLVDFISDNISKTQKAMSEQLTKEYGESGKQINRLLKQHYKAFAKILNK